MNEEARLRHNAAENDCTIETAREIDHFMAMSMMDWPKPLQALVRAGICGDVLVLAIVQYLKSAPARASEEQAR